MNFRDIRARGRASYSTVLYRARKASAFSVGILIYERDLALL